MNVLGIVLACIAILMFAKPELAAEWWTQFSHYTNAHCIEAKP
jgi:hypothetical protein